MRARLHPRARRVADRLRSLTARLVLTAVVLALAVSVLLGTATTLVMRHALTERLDNEVRSTLSSVLETPPTPPGVQQQTRVDLRNLAPGTLIALLEPGSDPQAIVVGDGVWFGQDVFVSDAGHGYQDPDVPIGDQFGSHDPVVIGPGSWIGHGAILLQGTRLGRNVVVAAGSVVRGDVPDHAVVAGTPARVVRRYEPGIGWVGRTGDVRPVVRADYLQDALTELRERA